MLDLEKMSEMMKDPEQQGLVFSEMSEYIQARDKEAQELKEKAEKATQTALETSNKLIDYSKALTLNQSVTTPVDEPKPKDMEDYIMNFCDWKDVAMIMLGKKEVPNFDN